ncbi:MAG: CAP domain-containing protein [Dehalococcoidia bacterium]
MFIRLSLPLVAIAALVTALASSGVTARAAVTPDQQSAMLAMHNKFRRDVAAAETARLGRTVTIPDLTWSAAAAVTAQAWADHLAATGTFEHNAGRGALGENLTAFESSVPFPNPNPTSVDQAFGPWRDEASSYRWDTNTCATVCGHYTQLVWATSTGVGCGVAIGGGALLPGGYRTVWVCNYAPART